MAGEHSQVQIQTCTTRGRRRFTARVTGNIFFSSTVGRQPLQRHRTWHGVCPNEALESPFSAAAVQAEGKDFGHAEHMSPRSTAMKQGGLLHLPLQISLAVGGEML